MVPARRCGPPAAHAVRFACPLYVHIACQSTNEPRGSCRAGQPFLSVVGICLDVSLASSISSAGALMVVCTWQTTIIATHVEAKRASKAPRQQPLTVLHCYLGTR